MSKPLYLVLVLAVFLCRICTSTVIIVGTGAAGIAAATRLLKNNVTDILLLEAENRIGGRIYSAPLGDGKVDIGAEWCDGQEDNIIYSLLKEYGILKSTQPIATKDTFYTTGERVDADLSEKLFKVLGSIYTPYGNRKVRNGTNLGEYCLDRYFPAISNLHLTARKQLDIAYDFLGYFNGFVRSAEGALSWFEPAAQSDYRDPQGELSLNWDGHGFELLLDILMQKFPNTSRPLPIDDKILLNKEVKKIVWDKRDNGVTVRCSDGSLYHGKQLIFTPSLGVLKRSYTTMFKPQLPMAKQRAIETLGIGAVLKAIVLFPTRWWPEDFYGANFIWSALDEVDNVPQLSKFVKNDKVWVRDAVFLIPEANNPNVLCMWFTGRSIPDIEQLTNAEALEGVNFVLDRFLGDTYQLTYPTTLILSKWYTNPHFRGTYSYQTVASRQEASNKELAKPLSNRNGDVTLMFAGESTHPYYYSTAHGAVETGFREANRVLSILKGD